MRGKWWLLLMKDPQEGVCGICDVWFLLKGIFRSFLHGGSKWKLPWRTLVHQMDQQRRHCRWWRSWMPRWPHGCDNNPQRKIPIQCASHCLHDEHIPQWMIPSQCDNHCQCWWTSMVFRMPWIQTCWSSICYCIPSFLLKLLTQSISFNIRSFLIWKEPFRQQNTFV